MASPDPSDRELGGIDRYLAVMDGIPGWFTPLDARLMQVLSAGQVARGVTGDLLEIGVYQGRTACFLGFLPTGGERLHVCDPFGPVTSGEPTGLTTEYRKGTRERFEERYAGFHDRPPVVHPCPSDELAGRVAPATFRFVHVDGSHAFEDVARDLALVRTLLVPGGIVAIDDYCGPHTPGVALATWSEVVAGTLTPVCITALKLYAVVGDDPAAALMVDDVRTAGFLVEEHHLGAERDLLRVQEPTAPTGDRGSSPGPTVRRVARVARRRVARVARRLRRVVRPGGARPR